MKKIFGILFIILQAFSVSISDRSGEPIRQIESIKDAAGRLYLFKLGNDGKVYYVRQTDKNSSFTVSGKLNNTTDSKGDYPGPAPAVLLKKIAVGQTAEGNIAVYGIDNVTAGWVSYQSSNTDTWGNWQKYHGDFTQLIAMRDDKCQRTYGLHSDGSVVFSYMTGTNKFGGWRQLYGSNLKQIICDKTPGRFTSSCGRAYVFALSNDGSVYVSNEEQGSRVQWTSWSSLGGVGLKKIEVGKTQDERLYLFAIGGDNDTYERHQLTKDGQWSDWSTLLGSNNFKDISSTINSVGQIHFLGLHINGSVEVIWQTTPGGNTWSGWLPFGGSEVQSIKCDRTEDGRGVIFAIGGDGEAYYRWQVVPNGDWSEWSVISN